LPLVQHVLELNLLAWKNGVGVLNAAVRRQSLRPSELLGCRKLDALTLGLIFHNASQGVTRLNDFDTGRLCLLNLVQGFCKARARQGRHGSGRTSHKGIG